MTLLLLVLAVIMANIAIWSGQKSAATWAIACITAAFVLGWIENPANQEHLPYVAHQHAAQFHDHNCIDVRDAIEHGEKLDEFQSIEEAKKAGLTPHRCVAADYLVTRKSTYTVTTPAR